jgi:putative SOS response-associated peptidase YedK
MCFSARIETAFREYLRITGAEVDLQQFYEIYSARMADQSVRIPRGLDRNFDNPKSDAERRIKALIAQHRDVTASQLETEIFAQRKRLADADRKLLVKETKAARESKRIATGKMTAALERLSLQRGVQPHELDARVFPMHYVPIVINHGGRVVVRLARYHCRQAGKPPSIDRQFPGLYNARRDNLEKFWREQFGAQHALMLAESFFENVERHGRNTVLHFVPRPATTMLIACLYSHWVDPKDGKHLLSFAAITDEPPAEVRDAGHDRMIVNIQAQNVPVWLAPQGRPLNELQAILSDRQTPYYAHEELAA